VTYKEQAEKLIELLDEDDWLWTEIHERVAQSEVETAILKAARDGLVTADSFNEIYHKHTVEIVEMVCETAKIILSEVEKDA